MNDPQNHIPFISHCPANFEGKLESRMIRKAYNIGEWEKLGTVHAPSGAGKLILKEKASLAIDKAQEMLKPAVKDMEKKIFRCLADAEEEVCRFKTCIVRRIPDTYNRNQTE